MIAYIEYLNFPLRVAVVLIAIFFIMQLIGEILEFKGKVVPEALKIRKYFVRKKMERQTIQEVSAMLTEVKKSLDDMNQHYSTDNINMRNEWIKHVNECLTRYDHTISEISTKLDKNNSDTLSLLIDNKRSAIISFASAVIDEEKPVTKEQFNRVFRVYEEYEAMIAANGMTNGEVDIAIRIIRESYENHMRNHTFIEDVRGYEQ